MKTIDSLTNLENKKVLVRVDFNVPLKGETIRDDNRIVAALPTIKALLEKGSAVVLMSHLGKVNWGKATDEEIEKQKAKNNMQYVYPRLKELLGGYNVYFVNATRGEELKAAINKLGSKEVLLVQNTRYEKGESKNDPALSEEWASYVDAFVMDAFGSAHRAHASTYGVPEALKKAGKEVALGFLMEKEVRNLGVCVETKEENRPYVAILGGSKVSTKIKVIDSLLKKCDKILIGGGMSYTFRNAVYGIKVGVSLFEADQVEYARKCYASGKIVLPIDTVVGKGFNVDEPDKPLEAIKIVEGDIPDEFEGLDIGPKTIELYKKEIAGAKTIFWNGPMGAFENPQCVNGTKAVCEACALATDNGAFSVIGGGDSAAAAKEFGYSEKFSHVSTGGGASLEMIENDGHLPGIDIIG